MASRASKNYIYKRLGKYPQMTQAPRRKAKHEKGLPTHTRENIAKIKRTGSFHGKSNALGRGGRAAQLKAHGVPGGVIGMLARRAGAAPGGPNFHGGKKKAKHMKHEKHMKRKASHVNCKACKAMHKRHS